MAKKGNGVPAVCDTPATLISGTRSGAGTSPFPKASLRVRRIRGARVSSGVRMGDACSVRVGPRAESWGMVHEANRCGWSRADEFGRRGVGADRGFGLGRHWVFGAVLRTAQFEPLAPTLATDPGQINAQLGQQRADAIAAQIGLKKENTLTEKQFLEFITGGGNSGDKASAALADRSVQIFINTTGNPLRSNVDGVPTETVLASYGLFVNEDGLLMSLANRIAPTRIANRLLIPERLHQYVVSRQPCNTFLDPALQVGVRNRGPVWQPSATDLGSMATRDQHQRTRARRSGCRWHRRSGSRTSLCSTR